MLALLTSWLSYSAAIWLTAELLPGFKVKGFGGAMIVAVVLGLLNVLIGWALFVLIALGTLGLGFVFEFITRLLVMAILLVIADKLSTSLKIKSFGSSLLGAGIITVIVSIVDRIF